MHKYSKWSLPFTFPHQIYAKFFWFRLRHACLRIPFFSTWSPDWYVVECVSYKAPYISFSVLCNSFLPRRAKFHSRIDTLNERISCINMKHKFSHPFITAFKIRVLCALICDQWSCECDNKVFWTQQLKAFSESYNRGGKKRNMLIKFRGGFGLSMCAGHILKVEYQMEQCLWLSLKKYFDEIYLVLDDSLCICIVPVSNMWLRPFNFSTFPH